MVRVYSTVYGTVEGFMREIYGTAVVQEDTVLRCKETAVYGRLYG